MKKRHLGVSVLAAVCITMAGGCGLFDSKEEESSSIVAENIKESQSGKDDGEQEITEAPTDEPEKETHGKVTYDGDLNALPNDGITWGVGVHTYDDNRPVDPVNMQKKYGEKYAVDWVKEDEPVIYLTFDEGYENGYTGQILDVLKEKNVKAVFFITMPYAKTEQELIKRMIDEGHVVGSHSVTHPSGGMMTLSVEKQKNEYNELHNYVLETYGYEMWLFRPPTGAFSEQTLAVANACGYRSVMWSFAYADWDPANQMEVGKALDNATKKLHNGAIYLLHAVSETNTKMLGDFIDQTRAKGFEFKKYD